jgi:predicted dehydrogenase
MTANDEPLRAGVIGIGSMGRNHARVYGELPNTELVGVADLDVSAAERVAAEFETVATDPDTLLESVDIVSVAVPTPAHASVVEDCLDAGVHALVEKPFVTDLAVGRDLASRARELGITIQVGHVERFNPAVRTLTRIVDDLDIIAIDAQRVGPPVDRDRRTDVVFDLMIHDLDIAASLVDREAKSITASATADGDYATARIDFDGVLATFTASRVTQRKIRRLGITARDCRVVVDYIEQSVEIHRSAAPAFVEENGDLRHSTESVVERPMVESGEPLKAELRSFADAVRNGDPPVVTAEDGLRSVELSHNVLSAATDNQFEEVMR